MQQQKSLLVLVICLSAAFADIKQICDECEFSTGGIGYLPGENCIKFIQCVRQPDGSIKEVVLCCPEGTVWNQDLLTCVAGECDAPRYPMCPNYTNVEGNCTLLPHPTNKFKYFAILADGSQQEMMCGPKTSFVAENCTCGHDEEGGPCYDDPLLHFPYAFDMDDIQCPRAVGTGHGDAFVNTDEGCLQLDGDGDFSTFSYLDNYFSINSPDDFTVSLWFKQTTDGYENLNNLIEGLIGNGDCNQQPTFYLTLANETVNGGITAGDSAEFTLEDGDAADRFYAPANVWCQVAIRFQPGLVTLFLNGMEIGQRPITGEMQGTQTGTSVGLTYLDCIPNFFTGCIDDVMVFVRYVSDAEMSWCVFGNRRTGPGEETMYMCDNIPVWISV